MLEPTNYFILYGNERLEFKRLNKNAESTRVTIKVNPDCAIEVRASESVSLEEIEHAVAKRAKWISKQLTNFKQQNLYVLPCAYVSGESHFYLGRRYVLKVNIDKLMSQSVKLSRGKLEINAKNNNPEKLKKLLYGWYIEKAQEIFNNRLEVLLKYTPWVTEMPQVRIIRMAKQWGSCSPGGHIILNPNLVKAPRECIDYVLLHELCHLAEHNHSNRFYHLMDQTLPKWHEIKTFLDNNASKYINC